MVHFAAVRQEKSLSVGTAVERGGTDLSQDGDRDKRGTTACSAPASQESGKRISETKPDRKEQNAPSLMSAMQTGDGQKQQFCHVIGSPWGKQTKLNQSAAFINCASQLLSCLLMAERITSEIKKPQRTFFFFFFSTGVKSSAELLANNSYNLEELDFVLFLPPEK